VKRSERDEQIQIALSHIKYKLKQRGDNPSEYNHKFLLDKATKVIDDYLKEHDGKMPYRKVGVIENEP